MAAYSCNLQSAIYFAIGENILAKLIQQSHDNGENLIPLFPLSALFRVNRFNIIKDTPRRTDAAHSLRNGADRASVHGAKFFMRIDLEKFKADRLRRIEKAKIAAPQQPQVEHKIKIGPEVKELFRKVRKARTGCWNWKGAVDSAGYGQAYYNGRQWGTHRLIYFLFNGPIPEKHLICHTCDNTRCVNPDHLFLGTSKDNVDDCISKGRRFEQSSEYKNFIKERTNRIKRNKIHVQAKILLAELASSHQITYEEVIDICKELKW